MPEQFENGRKFVSKSWLQDFGAIGRYLQPKCQSVFFQKRRKLFYFKIFKCLQDAVSKMCPFPFQSSVFKIYRFQNLPAKNVPFSSEQEAYPSNFSPFSKFAGIV